MRRVLLDLVREMRWAWLVMLIAFTIGGLWLLGRASGVGREASYGALAADLVGVLSMMSATDALRMMRWVFTVPVRRRDIGRGLWLVAVIIPVSLTVSAKVLIVALGSIMSMPSAVNFRWVASSGIFDLAFVGSVCWLLIQVLKPGRRVVPRWLARAFWTIGTLAGIAGVAALGWYMPTVASSWNWPIAGVLGGMLALTVAGYRQSERLAIDGGSLGLLTGGPSDSGARKSVLAAPMAFAHRLAGPRHMLWRQFLAAALVQLLWMILFSVLGALPLAKGQPVMQQFVGTWSDMDADLRSMMWAMGWIVYSIIGMKRWQASRILVLRGLPLSAREINRLLLLRPVVTWLALWLVALPFVGMAASASYAWLGLGTLVSVMGITGLVGAALLQWHRFPLANLAMTGTNYLLLFGHPWRLIHSSALLTAPGQLVLLLLGLAGLRAAYLWQSNLLTKSSALYRRT